MWSRSAISLTKSCQTNLGFELSEEEANAVMEASGHNYTAGNHLLIDKAVPRPQLGKGVRVAKLFSQLRSRI